MLQILLKFCCWCLAPGPCVWHTIASFILWFLLCWSRPCWWYYLMFLASAAWEFLVFFLRHKSLWLKKKPLFVVLPVVPVVPHHVLKLHKVSRIIATPRRVEKRVESSSCTRNSFKNTWNYSVRWSLKFAMVNVRWKRKYLWLLVPALETCLRGHCLSRQQLKSPSEFWQQRLFTVAVTVCLNFRRECERFFAS